MRDLVFISHATPEESIFARWLGLQLVRNGYSIWSDVTKLIAGESFWSDIETAIRKRTAKLIFVLSQASNRKQGTLDELHLARTVAAREKINDFIIPVKVDEIHFSDTNVALHRLNVVDFTKSWAEGLRRVLDKLVLDDVPKCEVACNSRVVADWWRKSCDGSQIVKREAEQYLSNWFPIKLPDGIFVHRLASGLSREQQPNGTFAIRDNLISFANARELGIPAIASQQLSTVDALRLPISQSGVTPFDVQNAVSHVLTTAWSAAMTSAGMKQHSMSQHRQCAYFTPDMFETKFTSFVINGDFSGRRSLTGKSKGRTWHFGITADVSFETGCHGVIRPHVLFSDDGKTIWDSAARLHSARRSVCKGWWNDKWRDLLLASMSWLAERLDGGETIRIPLSTSAAAFISACPITFDAPVTYDDERVRSGILDDADLDVDDGEEGAE